MRGCNRKHFARRLAEGRRACNRVEKSLQPLCRHMLKLAQSDIRGVEKYLRKNPGSTWARSRCQRAGQDISKAIRLADKHPRR